MRWCSEAKKVGKIVHVLLSGTVINSQVQGVELGLLEGFLEEKEA